MSEWNEETDLLVFGTGAAGLSAGLVGAIEGMRVLVCEKTALFGGTTATSGGAIWIVAPTISREPGIDDSIELGRVYLRHELGSHYREDLVEAFLAKGAMAIDYLAQNSVVRFAIMPI